MQASRQTIDEQTGASYGHSEAPLEIGLRERCVQCPSKVEMRCSSNRRGIAARIATVYSPIDALYI